jgi:putative two-component system response regulator
MHSVLVVDDEPAVRALTSRWLEIIGFPARAASGAEQALEVMAADSAGVVLCDVRMPGHDGLWLAEQLRAQYPDTAIIMATGGQDLDAAIASLRLGVLDYLVKPFSRERLRESVERGIDWHHAALEARRQREALHQQAQVRHAHLSAALAGLNLDSVASVDAVLIMLTLRDRAAYDHAHRVAKLAERLAAALGVDGGELEPLESAALLHELGRLTLPDDLANKETSLSPEERDLVREHPRFAHEVLRHVKPLAAAADLIVAMHERFDGCGYPAALGGDAIPLGSRILAVADTFDTLSQSESVPGSLARSGALKEMSRQRGSHFDPAVVDALVTLTSVQ